MKMNFYARINNEGICEQIVSTPKLVKMSDYIPIDNYNESLLWRKWENKQWSNQKYVPEIDPNIQDRLDTIDALEKELQEKSEIITRLEEKVSILSDTLDFLIQSEEE